jgi:hypothetical protein
LACAVANDPAVSLKSWSSPLALKVHLTTAVGQDVGAKSTTIGLLWSRVGSAEVPARQGPLSLRLPAECPSAGRAGRVPYIR